MSELIFVRHGEAQSNVDVEHGVVGSDKSLTKEGIQQVRETAAFLGRITLAHEIYSSPYKRTMETSEIISEALGLDIITDDRLKEISKGDWHGKPVQEVIDLEGEVPDDEKHTFRPPNGENWEDVGDRMLDLIGELEADGAQQRLLVSHNHPIQMAVGALLLKPVAAWEDVSVKNASVTRVNNVDGLWRLDETLVDVRPYEFTDGQRQYLERQSQVL